MGKGKFAFKEIIGQVGTKTFGCICFLGIAGVILLIVGGIELKIALVDTRAELISKYNDAVESWKKTENGTAHGDFIYARFIENSPLKYGVLDASSSLDKLNDLDSRLEQYTALKYTSSDALFPPVLSSSLPCFKANLSSLSPPSLVYDDCILPVYRREVARGELRCGTGSSEKQEKECQRNCASAGGKYSYDDHKCLMFYVLNSVCVKVSKNNGVWVHNDKYGGYGCRPLIPSDDHEQYMKDDWSPYIYKVYNLKGQEPPSQFSSASIKVTVREVDDPYIYAAYLTNGTYYFGKTVREKATVGVLLLVLGFSSFLVPFCMFVWCYRQWKGIGRTSAGTAYEKYIDEPDRVPTQSTEYSQLPPDLEPSAPPP